MTTRTAAFDALDRIRSMLGAQSDADLATLRAALAPPQEGEAEECLRKIDRALQVVFALCKGEQKWVMSIPVNEERDPDIIIADALSFAARLLRATQSNGHSPVGDESHRRSAEGAKGCHEAPDAPCESPTQSAPAQEPIGWITPEGMGCLLAHMNIPPEVVYCERNERMNATAPLYAAPQPDEAVALLRALEPHLDKLICYASTTDEYEPNAIVARIRAFLKDRT